MTAEQDPFFPLPEGPVTHAVEVEPAPETDDDAPRSPLWTPGADGFGVENTFTVDNSTPGALVVLPENTLVTPVFLSPGAVDARQITIPFAPGWQPLDRNFTDLEVAFGRFRMPATKKINRITIMLAAATGPAGTFDIGIYNAAGNQRLTSSGAVALGAFAAPAPLTRSVGEVTLNGGTTYLLAVDGVKDPGPFTVPSYVAADWQSIAFTKWNGDNFANWLSGTVTLGAAALPADLSAAGPPKASNASVAPFAMLWHS